jgi:uncharacterized membrane protein YdjX (TVP38/TMEM64 family)
MRALLVTVARVAFVVGLITLLVRRFELPVLEDPSPWLGQIGPPAAVVGIGLLLFDVLLPVPSSLVMMAHGALYGVLIGTLLSLAGSVGAAALGFWIGRQGGPLLAKLVPADQLEQTGRLLERWGSLAIIASRPVPILAETMTIVAGTSPMTWRKLLVAAALGTFPAALLYATAGGTGADPEDNFQLVALAMLLATGLWLTGRGIVRRSPPSRPQ